MTFYYIINVLYYDMFFHLHHIMDHIFMDIYNFKPFYMLHSVLFNLKKYIPFNMNLNMLYHYYHILDHILLDIYFLYILYLLYYILLYVINLYFYIIVHKDFHMFYYLHHILLSMNQNNYIFFMIMEDTLHYMQNFLRFYNLNYKD